MLLMPLAAISSSEVVTPGMRRPRTGSYSPVRLSFNATHHCTIQM